MFATRKLLQTAMTPFPLLGQIRNIRPKIKISKDTFEIHISIRQYAMNEVKVKARRGFVTVEGSQERKTTEGFLIRRFEKKFRLPKDCSEKDLRCTLTKEGMLVVSARRRPCDINLPCDTYVKIVREREKGSSKPPDDGATPGGSNPCSAYLKK